MKSSHTDGASVDLEGSADFLPGKEKHGRRRAEHPGEAWKTGHDLGTKQSPPP